MVYEYYNGDGVYYNPEIEEFIQNDITYNLITNNIDNLSNIASTALVNNVSAYYSYLMSLSTYGATNYSNVTSSQ